MGENEETTQAVETEQASGGEEQTFVSGDGVPLYEKVCIYRRRSRAYGVFVEGGLLMIVSLLAFIPWLCKNLSLGEIYWIYLAAMVFVCMVAAGVYCIPVTDPRKEIAKMTKKTKGIFARYGVERMQASWAKANTPQGRRKSFLMSVLSCVIMLALVGAIAVVSQLFADIKPVHSILLSVGAALMAVMGITLSQNGTAGLNCDEQWGRIFTNNGGGFDEEKELAAWSAYKLHHGSFRLSDFLPHDIGVLAINGFLVLALVAIMAVQPFVARPLYTGYVDDIPVNQSIGIRSDMSELQRYLGKPDMVAKKTHAWGYFSYEYRKAYKRLEKLEKKAEKLLENNGSADEFDKIITEIAELTEKMSEMNYESLAVQFTDEHYGRVAQVLLDKDCGKGAQKKVLEKMSVEGDATIKRDEDLSQKKIYVRLYYTDGSYACTYLPEAMLGQVDRTQAGEQTVKGTVGFGEIEVTLTVE